MMRGFKRAYLDHLLRAAHGITGQSAFVVVGSASLVGRLRNVPPAMTMTEEADIYALSRAVQNEFADLIDGSIGENSMFHRTFGYYADGVVERTAIMPDDWRDRATVYIPKMPPTLSALCPDPNDIALAKICAWREKDLSWIRHGVASGVLDTQTMISRVGRMPTDRGPAIEELRRRLAGC